MSNELSPELKAKNPEFAKWYEGANLHKPTPPSTDTFKDLGEWIGEQPLVSDSINGVVSSIARGPASAVTHGALYAGIPAYLLAKYLFPDLNSSRVGGVSSLLGGLAGYGLNQAAQPTQKSAYFSSYIAPEASTDTIASKLAQDPNLNKFEENQLLGIIQTLPSQNQSELRTVISSASGAAVGMLVARYLLKLGITGQLLVSLAGAAIGYGLSQNKLETSAVGAHNRFYTL